MSGFNPLTHDERERLIARITELYEQGKLIRGAMRRGESRCSVGVAGELGLLLDIDKQAALICANDYPSHAAAFGSLVPPSNYAEVLRILKESV